MPRIGLQPCFSSKQSPTEAMLKDHWFLLDLAAASATILYVIYGR